MYIQLSDKYRMEGQKLYKKRGSAFILCAIVPPGIKGLAQAGAWYKIRQ